MGEQPVLIWPYYKAHHVVQAVEIVSIKPNNQGGALAETNPPMPKPLVIPREFFSKYSLAEGAFIVEDADGDYSCIEHEKFLDCYTLVGVNKPVDTERLQRDLQKAEGEAAMWRTRYDDLREGLQALLDSAPQVK
jgi:hypothetical protein